MASQDLSTHHHLHHIDIAPRYRDDEGHQEDVKFATLLAAEEKDIESNYFKSTRFIGTMVSMSLTVVSSYFGFAVPASVLTFINIDIGMSSVPHQPLTP